MSTAAQVATVAGWERQVMTTHPSRAVTVATVVGAVALAAGLAACRGAATPGEQPSSAAASPTPSTTAATNQHGVYGTLDVLIAFTTPQSKVPDPPISYSLLVKPAAGSVSTAYPVAADGTFALDLDPGAYEVALLKMNAADLGAEPEVLPLHATKKLTFDIPSAGCAYGGVVNVTYGRLPAGSQQQQQELVETASRNNHENYSFVYRPDGGFVLAGAAVSMPDQTQWPAAAQGCTPHAFTLS